MRKHLFCLLYGIALAVFTAYVLLDSFVLVRVYESASTAEVEPAGCIHPTPEPAFVTERSYQDANITLTIDEYREHNTTIYVADVVLTSPTLLKTALAQDAYGRNVTETTSAMAERKSAILAVKDRKSVV